MKRTNTQRKMRESPKVIHRRNSKGIPSTQVCKKIEIDKLNLLCCGGGGGRFSYIQKLALSARWQYYIVCVHSTQWM